MIDEIANLVGALAWPLVALIAVLIIRKKLPMIMDGIERLKVGSFEVAFRKTAAGVATALVGENPDALEAAASPSDASVGTFVGQEYGRLVAAVAAVSSEQPTPIDVHSLQAGVDSLVEQNLISSNTAEAIRGLTMMRNLALRAAPGEVSPVYIQQFSELVDATIASIGRSFESGPNE